jgi:hypothetical protein
MDTDNNLRGTVVEPEPQQSRPDAPVIDPVKIGPSTTQATAEPQQSTTATSGTIFSIEQDMQKFIEKTQNELVVRNSSYGQTSLVTEPRMQSRSQQSSMLGGTSSVRAPGKSRSAIPFQLFAWEEGLAGYVTVGLVGGFVEAN